MLPALLALAVAALVASDGSGAGAARHDRARLYAVSDRQIGEYPVAFPWRPRIVPCSECSAAGLMRGDVLGVAEFRILHWYQLPGMRPIRSQAFPDWIDFVAPDGYGHAYVVSRLAGISYVDAASGRVARFVALKLPIASLSVAPNGDVAVGLPRHVAVYARGLRRLRYAVPVAAEDTQAVFDSRGDLYVASETKGTLALYRDGDVRPRKTVRAGLRPHAFLRSDALGNVYAVDTPCLGAEENTVVIGDGPGTPRPIRHKGRILVFGPGARGPIRTIGGLRKVEDVAVDRDGTLYEAEQECAYIEDTWVGVVPPGGTAIAARLRDVLAPRHIVIAP
jgi:hypothetical protein